MLKEKSHSTEKLTFFKISDRCATLVCLYFKGGGVSLYSVYGIAVICKLDGKVIRQVGKSLFNTFGITRKCYL